MYWSGMVGSTSPFELRRFFPFGGQQPCGQGLWPLANDDSGPPRRERPILRSGSGQTAALKRFDAAERLLSQNLQARFIDDRDIQCD
jgi:hypothetical protein